MCEKETTVRNSSGGIGFIGLLTIVFITLKLTGVINWSWWLVLLPLLISGGFTALIVLFVLFCLFMAWVTGQLK